MIEIREGWQCPHCKRVWNPDIQVCTCQMDFPVIDKWPYDWTTRKLEIKSWTYKIDPKNPIIVRFYQE